MKSETELEMDNLVQSLGELAKGAQKLAREAVQLYTAEVAVILKSQSRDSRRIERYMPASVLFFGLTFFDHL